MIRNKIDLSFQDGVSTQLVTAAHQMYGCSLVYKMASHYLDQLENAEELDEKRQMFKSFCENAKELAENTKGILNWQSENLIKHDVNSNECDILRKEIERLKEVIQVKNMQIEEMLEN